MPETDEVNSDGIDGAEMAEVYSLPSSPCTRANWTRRAFAIWSTRPLVTTLMRVLSSGATARLCDVAQLATAAHVSCVG